MGSFLSVPQGSRDPCADEEGGVKLLFVPLCGGLFCPSPSRAASWSWRPHSHCVAPPSPVQEVSVSLSLLCSLFPSRCINLRNSSCVTHLLTGCTLCVLDIGCCEVAVGQVLAAMERGADPEAVVVVLGPWKLCGSVGSTKALHTQ